MRLHGHIRPGVGLPLDEGRGERGGAGAPGGVDVAPAPRPGVAHITSREIMAEVRERLAAKGFDWGDALRAGRRASPAERERGR